LARGAARREAVLGVSANHAEPNGSAHVVRIGATRSRLSIDHGTSVNAIAAVNGIPNPDLIYADQMPSLP